MFYLIEITTYTDGTKDAYGVYPYTTIDETVAAFHQKLAGAIRSANYASELCHIIDENGTTWREERWVRPVTEQGAQETESEG